VMKSFFFFTYMIPFLLLEMHILKKIAYAMLLNQ
jgi:hypothetical protein